MFCYVEFTSFVIKTVIKL